MFNTFEEIFIFFRDICNCSTQRLNCCIWVKSEDITPTLRDKVYGWIAPVESNIKDIMNISTQIEIRFNNGSYIDILPAVCMKGKRYHFSAFSNTIDEDFVNTIIRPCSTSGFAPKRFFLPQNEKNKCHYCICKTCAIAEINGGAPGCGNCKNCDLTDGCRSCNEYYNPTPHINDIIDKMLEYSHLSRNYAYVFPKDENDKIKIEYMGDFIKEEESE